MNEAERDSAIEEFAAGGNVLADAVAGLDAAALQARPADGSWSIQEIVVHMLDSELVAVHRMKSIAAQDLPLLIGYDESAFIRALAPHRMPTADVLTSIDCNRRLCAAILRTLPAEAFDRCGIHNEIGKISLGDMLAKYNWHLTHHLKFIAAKRTKLGK